MIKTILSGKVRKNGKQDWLHISEDGKLLVVLQQTYYKKPGACQIYIKKGEDCYQEIEHNIPSQCYCSVYNEQKNTSYIIEVCAEYEQKHAQRAVYRIDINTRLITQIYYTDKAQFFLFYLPFIYDLDDNRDLRIICIDSTTKLKELMFQCVKKFDFLKYKGEDLLAIQYLNNEEQYYREPEFERMFVYNRKRLFEIKTTLFIRSPDSLKINDYLYRVHHMINSYNSYFYEFRDDESYYGLIFQVGYNLLGQGKLLQMRPKSKIFRKFKSLGESHIISMPQLIIHTTKIEEEYQNCIIDIRNAQQQQILSNYEIKIRGDRLLELRDQEVWIYDLEEIL